MKILSIQPGCRPEVREIDDTLETMRQMVGGLIQAIYPFEEPVALICNDEGKLLGLPMNRGLRDEKGELYDILCGTFFLCGTSGEDFTSLTDGQIEKYQQMFAVPELFLRMGNRLVIVPLD